jgi:MFS family permease
MRRLWLASFCSETGEWMLQIALPVLVFQATGSTASTALMMILGLLPMVVLSPATGLVADRVHRPRLLLVVCLGQAVVAAPLLIDDAMCWVVMALQTSLAAFFEPARNALVADLVPVERRTAANGLLAAGTNIARLVGAWLGGTLLAVGGIPLVYAVYAGILVVGAVAMCGRFPVTRPAKAVKLPPLRVDRSLLPIGIALTLMCVAQGIFLVRFVPFVLETLGAGSGEVGLLRGVQAIGGLAAGFAVATVARRVAPTGLFAWGALAFGLVSACIWHGPALTTAVGVYVGMFIAVGVPGVIANSGLAAVLQSAVPAAATGRLLAAAFALMTLATTAGMLVAGVVGSPLLLDAQAFLHVAAGLLLLAHQHRHRVRDARRARFARGEAPQLQAGEQRDDRAGEPVR